MPNRSVSSGGDISRSVIVTGDGNQVTLRFGSSGLELPVERKQVIVPDRHRPQGGQKRQRELDVLDPARGRLPLIGREQELADLQAWLENKADISVHALIGSAGTGKTRLAIGLCAAIDREASAGSGWLAGFLSPDSLPRLAEVFATTTLEWTRSTLLVIDYAAQGYEALGRWLDLLAAGPALETARLRILLLERQAPEGFGWWHELCASPLNASADRRGLFRQPRPGALAGLADLETRRRVLAEALAATADLHRTSPDPVPARDADPALDARLADPVFGNALSLVMAGVIAQEKGLRAALALRRLDAARHLAGRELARFAKLAGTGPGAPEPPDARAIRHLVAFNGMAGGLPVAGLTQTLHKELAKLGAAADTMRLSDLLQQELPPPATHDEAAAGALRLATIQPDLLGEAVIVEAFDTTPERREAGLPALRRAYDLTGAAAAQALIRLLQDFGYAAEDPMATERERKTGRWLLGWLQGLAGEISDPEALEPLAFALPQQTLVLRELAAKICNRLAEAHAAAVHPGGDIPLAAVYRATVWTGNLSVRLNALGDRNGALKAAEQAEALARQLFEVDADRFRGELARSLNNLANGLGDLERREEALIVAQKAADLCRTLAADRPDAPSAELSVSLNTLANGLGALGRGEEALAMAQEVVDLRRALAAIRPDTFTPDLAASLDNLAVCLSVLGRREEALTVAQEAVGLYRALAAARPDAFTPDLTISLNNLATFLSALERLEEALAAAQEAVDMRRALAAVRPDAFRPGLSKSLINLANMLSALERREEALAVAQEAVDLSRALAAAQPGAFSPDLAMSLNNLTGFLGALGQREEALAVAQEAVALYRALAAARPDVFTPYLATSLSNFAIASAMWAAGEGGSGGAGGVGSAPRARPGLA